MDLSWARSRTAKCPATHVMLHRMNEHPPLCRQCPTEELWSVTKGRPTLLLVSNWLGRACNATWGVSCEECSSLTSRYRQGQSPPFLCLYVAAEVRRLNCGRAAPMSGPGHHAKHRELTAGRGYATSFEISKNLRTWKGQFKERDTSPLRLTPCGLNIWT